MGNIQLNNNINKELNKTNESNTNYLNDVNIMNDSLMSFKNKFKESTYDKTPKFNQVFNNKLLIGRVIDIYDGDTITCVIDLYGNNLSVNIRLGDIDTCEMKSKNEKA